MEGGKMFLDVRRPCRIPHPIVVRDDIIERGAILSNHDRPWIVAVQPNEEFVESGGVNGPAHRGPPERPLGKLNIGAPGPGLTGPLTVTVASPRSGAGIVTDDDRVIVIDPQNVEGGRNHCEVVVTDE